MTAAADLCRGQLGSPSVGILLEGRVPWLVSRGVPASIRGSLARVAHAAATIDAGISATEIGARLAQVLRPIPAQVIAAGRAALVVGITRSETEERLIARVAASVQDAVKTTPADHTSDVADRVDDGLAWTAHEFRAPLGAVRAVLDRLVESGSPKPEDPMLLRRARDEVDRLLEVVDPLLRCAAGEIGESADPVDLESVALDVVDAASGSEDWRDRRFSLQVSGGRLPVRADASMIAVALGNLLRNALAHAGDEHPVGVSVFRWEKRAVVQVWDRGPGVPPEERERVFQRSVRGRSAGSTPGHGLGLFIARRIAELYGGTVSIVDSPRGADFRFELPLCEVGWQPSES